MTSSGAGHYAQGSGVGQFPIFSQIEKQGCGNNNRNDAPEDNSPVKTPKSSKQTRCEPCISRHRACDLKRPVCSACLRMKQPVLCRWPDGQTTPNPRMAAQTPSGTASNNLNQAGEVPTSLPSSSSHPLPFRHDPSPLDPKDRQENMAPVPDQPTGLPGHQSTRSAAPTTNMDPRAAPPATIPRNAAPENTPSPQPSSGGSVWSGPYDNPVENVAALRRLEHREQMSNDSNGNNGTQTPQSHYPSLHDDSQNSMVSHSLPLSELRSDSGVDRFPAEMPLPQQAIVLTPAQAAGHPHSGTNRPIAEDSSLRRFEGYPGALGMTRPVRDAATPFQFAGMRANGRSQIPSTGNDHRDYNPGQNPRGGLPYAAVTGACPNRAPAPVATPIPTPNVDSFANGTPSMLGGQTFRQAVNTVCPELAGWQSRPDDDIYFGQFMTPDNNPWQNIDQILRGRVAAERLAAEPAPTRPNPPMRMGANGRPELALTLAQHTVYYPGYGQSTRFQHPDGASSGIFLPPQPEEGPVAQEQTQLQGSQASGQMLPGDNAQKREEEEEWKEWIDWDKTGQRSDQVD